MTAPALRTTARPSESLDARLAREQSTLQARSMAAVVLAVIGVVALALVASAWLMADGRWMTLPRAVPIAVWAAALAVAAGLVWALRTRNADVLSLTSLATSLIWCSLATASSYVSPASPVYLQLQMRWR